MSSAYPPPPEDPQHDAGQGLPPPPPGYYQQQPGSQPSGYQQQPGYPPSGYQQQPGYPAGRPMRPDEEKLWAVAAHLGPLLLSFIAPLVVWLVFRERSAYLDRTGKEALNMQISYAIYGLIAGFSLILLIGVLLLPLVGLAWFILMIIATVKVANHEEYRYPAILRFIS